MGKSSAGILMFKRAQDGSIELLLVHPGGPFWAKRDAGSWSIPKGEFEEDEDALAAAKREFQEETGTPVDGEFIRLNPIRQKGGKIVYAWAVEGDWDVSTLASNTFAIEWPRGSGKTKIYPEVDKAAWFSAQVAREKINPAQAALIDQLLIALEIGAGKPGNAKS